MSNRKPEHRLAGELIAGALVPHAAYRDQEFWNAKFPALSELMSVKAMIRERISFFRQDPTRNNAVLLIVMADLGWQLLRDIGNIKNDAKSLRTTLKWSAEAQRKIDLIEWIYAVHSALRHPTSNFLEYNWVLASPWPEDKQARLLEAAETLAAAMLVLDVHFNPRSGYEGEIAEKQILASNAVTYWNAELQKRRGGT